MTIPNPAGNIKARRRKDCIRVFKMSQEGMTVNQIADLIKKKPSQVSVMIKTGERFSEH